MRDPSDDAHAARSDPGNDRFSEHACRRVHLDTAARARDMAL